MHSQILLKCTLSIAMIEKLVKVKAIDQKVGERLTIEDIELSSTKELLQVRVKTSGRYNGYVDATFKLAVGDNDDLKLEDLIIQLEAKNILEKGANWILSHVLGDKIEARLQDKIQSTISQVIKELVSQYGNMEFKNGLTMTADIRELKFGMVDWDHENIFCSISSTAEINVTLRE